MRVVFSMMALCLACGVARAQSAQLEPIVRWEMPAECGAADSFVQQIELAPARLAQLAIDVHGAREAQTFVVTLRVARSSVTETRTLSAQTCEEAKSAAALIIAVLADAMEETATDPDPVETAPDVQPAIAEALQAQPVQGALALHASVRAQALVDFGTLNQTVIGGLRVEGALHIASWYVRLGVLALLRGEQLDEIGRGGVFDLAGGSVRGGYRFDLDTVFVDVEAGVDLAALFASGRGVEQAAITASFWGTTNVGVGVGVPFSKRFVLRVDIEAFVPWIGYTYAIENVGVVAQSNPVGVRGAFGAEVAF